MLKAWQLNDYEVWAGEDLERAIALAMKETCEDRETVFDPDCASEVPGETIVMDKMARRNTRWPKS